MKLTIEIKVRNGNYGPELAGCDIGLEGKAITGEMITSLSQIAAQDVAAAMKAKLSQPDENPPEAPTAVISPDAEGGL